MKKLITMSAMDIMELVESMSMEDMSMPEDDIDMAVLMAIAAAVLLLMAMLELIAIAMLVVIVAM